MISARGLLQGVKGWLNKPVATAETDPEMFFQALGMLPNPDPILRQMGRADAVYRSIMLDAHVMGEIRSIRGSFRSHSYRIDVGAEDDAKAAAARDLCESWMASGPPNKISDWLEVQWQMCSSIFTGFKVHELVWNINGDGKLVPEVHDRPGRRFRFDVNGAPLLVSKTAPMGAPVEPYQFVTSRHMPTTDNPYGLALLSSCFWPWTFKTGGWRYFVKYCERHGLPWPVGRYPMGKPRRRRAAMPRSSAFWIAGHWRRLQVRSPIWRWTRSVWAFSTAKRFTWRARTRQRKARDRYGLTTGSMSCR